MFAGQLVSPVCLCDRGNTVHLIQLGFSFTTRVSGRHNTILTIVVHTMSTLLTVLEGIMAKSLMDTEFASPIRSGFFFRGTVGRSKTEGRKCFI